MAIINIKKEFFMHDAQAGGFFPKTHTNPGIKIDKFIGETGQNYIIEGIRGSGKTHILKMINETCLNEFGEKKVLPIYVSLASVSEWVKEDLTFFRLHLYANIVRNSISTIEHNRDKIELAGNSDFKKALKRVAQMFGLNESENFDAILEEIKDYSDYLLTLLSYTPESFKETNTHESEESYNIELSGDIYKIKSKLGASERKKNSEQREVNFIGKNLAHQNAASFIVNYFKELKKILGHNYSYLLLDECSEVSVEAQKEVFRLFKLVRGAFGTPNTQENTAYFCASVYPEPLTYYPSQTKGDSFNFEVGHDAIMEYVSIDELTDEYLLFFKELTNKRIKEFLPDEYENYTDILENEKALVLASYFANGNVRRFIEILKHAYDRLVQRRGIKESGTIDKISAKDIEESLNSIVPQQVLSSNKLTSSDFDNLDKIIAKLTKRNKKNETENKEKSTENKLPANLYFTVSRSEAKELGNLLMQGAIHDKNKTRVRKYYKKDGNRGSLMMLDLATAFHDGAIDRGRAAEIFSHDLVKNAKSGYMWCQDISLTNGDD
ncbi:hypothetical protein [Bacillus subtilis]|uniref:hypothetical protein n=1 Tax=Bacillus subtilis TaxID=1423 RepID=UPI00227E5BB0|nr:hypothetical protein [Bacillus subtilis]MCY9209747.1 hypothetical protein [Bacillus subtilis]